MAKTSVNIAYVTCVVLSPIKWEGKIVKSGEVNLPQETADALLKYGVIKVVGLTAELAAKAKEDAEKAKELAAEQTKADAEKAKKLADEQAKLDAAALAAKAVDASGNTTNSTAKVLGN